MDRKTWATSFQSLGPSPLASAQVCTSINHFTYIHPEAYIYQCFSPSMTFTLKTATAIFAKTPEEIQQIRWMKL